MTPQAFIAKRFVSLVVTSLVDHPDLVDIAIAEIHGSVQVNVSVAGEDTPYVCGENGLMRDSIVELVKVLGSKTGATITVSIENCI
jgi:predicted RNA-binding protein YlqC (UPF0109 family)